jgi:enterochelin esterase-like enzyme
MKKLCLLVALFASLAALGWAGEDYPLGPDSQRQPGVPQGTATKYTWDSKIFPGTVRDYWVYVPAQYTPDKPACVMLFEDGTSYVKEDGRARIPIVFDNLIAKHDMPVTIAILIDPGVLKGAAPGQMSRLNRSYEYDGLSDRYARFLLDEMLPEVAKHYNLSTNPNDRAISGGSSGGICSFTVAWTHPEAFHRVLSFIGSFADLRGGDIYPALIRKTEPKPIRVFLQDGNHDLNMFAGDWWLSNQAMASALAYAGYDYKFVTGDKDHDMIQGGAILPDALRWLWRDHPQPIAKPPMNHLGDRQTGLVEVEPEWEQVSAAFPQSDCDPTGRYSKKKLGGLGIATKVGGCLSRDHSLLYVSVPTAKWVWSYQVQADGGLANGEPFFRLETPDESSASGAAGMAVDSKGLLYVATLLGIQICDAQGRVVGILNRPEQADPSSGPVSGVAFGGPDHQYLYAIIGNQIFRRHLVRKPAP